MTGFLKINGTLIPVPANFSGSYNNIEDTNESEAGTDRTIVTRLLKKEYSITLQVTDFWRQKLLAFGALNTVSFQVDTETALHGRFRVTGDTRSTKAKVYTVTAKFYQI